MTAAEAAASPLVVDVISKAARADKRTVISCLRGLSPYSVIWWRIHDAAVAAGVDALPGPCDRKRKARRVSDCATCEKLSEATAEIARLRARVEELEVQLAPPAPPARTLPAVVATSRGPEWAPGDTPDVPAAPAEPPAPTEAVEKTPEVARLAPARAARPAPQPRLRIVEPGADGDVPVTVAT